MPAPDVVVIGGGIIGLSIAEALVARGAPVHALPPLIGDRGQPPAPTGPPTGQARPKTPASEKLHPRAGARYRAV